MKPIGIIMTNILLGGKSLKEVGFPKKWKYRPECCWWETRYKKDMMKSKNLKTKETTYEPFIITDEQLIKMGVKSL